MRKRKQIGLRAMSTILAAVLLMAGMSTANLPIRDMSVSAKTLAELQDERQANESKIAEKQKKLDSLQSNMNENEQYQKTLKEKIALQQENLDIVSEELKRIGTSISETEDAIAQAEDDITVMEADIAIGLDEFKMRLRAMYVQGNDSLASALVGATDFYDLLSKYELMSRVANHDNDLVNTLKDKLETCNEKKAQLEKQQESLSKQQSDQQAKKDEFSTALMDLQDTYSETSDAQEQMEREKESLNADVSTLEKQNAELDAEEAEIKAAIAKAAEEQKRKEEEARKQKEAAEAAAAAQRQQEAQQQQQQQQQNNSSSNSNSNSNSSGNSNSNSNSSNNNSSSDNNNSNTTPSTDNNNSSGGNSSAGFTWPCPGFYTISSGYESRWGTFHGALDIAGGNDGAAVVASRGGTVVVAVSGCPHNYGKSSSCGCGGGYGNYVVIQHDGTYSTLYGHMASLTVSVGDTVSQGQTIGYVGSTGFSTGAHLHFEVRVNGSKVNPADYLY
ncbi:MAG: murein hydrolase activator EnvC family protein [Ruminococcus sp.]|jgi:murein DD-endopeptidase MepM/ murein hydrolase activator NlpD|uniref:murein hydrolase activator EnvC family protein n=1 Tax=uncultured Ruminococcus sp. TaxID=165186 RepID=UPI002623FB87|nr:M23 family metallopeptidase [uncultured Ruminococcus sp.]